MLQHVHADVGHQGRDRTLSLVRARFYWPGLESDVLNKVKNCEKCIKRKTIPAPSAELVNITSSQPMELVCIEPYCSCCLCLYFGSSIMLVTYFVNFR